MNDQNAPGAESVTRPGGDIGVSLPARTGRGQSDDAADRGHRRGAVPGRDDAGAGRQSRSTGQLEEIVVTATRRDVNLQNVAQSVTAFSTADIEQQAMQSTA